VEKILIGEISRKIAAKNSPLLPTYFDFGGAELLFDSARILKTESQEQNQAFKLLTP
jgi:hypothetical protein